MRINVSIIILCLSTLCFLSCGEQTSEASSLAAAAIDKQKFAELLSDAQLIESHNTVLRANQPYVQDSMVYYYAEVFKRHNVSSEQFYTSLKYYSSKPVLLAEIYEDAVAILKEKEKLLEGIDINSRPVINATSRQQLGEIILQTPVAQLMYTDSTRNITMIKDSLLSYLSKNDTLLSSFGSNVPSVEFTFAVNSISQPLYDQLREYVIAKIEKEAGID